VNAVPSLNITPEQCQIFLSQLPKSSTAYIAIKLARQYFNHVAPGAYNFIAECGVDDARLLLEIAERHCPDAKEGIAIAIGMARRVRERLAGKNVPVLFQLQVPSLSTR
jgi:hypothetical protein